MADSKSATPTASSSAAAEPKRQRRKSEKKSQDVKDVKADAEENGTDWVPKGKSWDKDVLEVDTIVRDPENNGLYAWLVFTNGRKSRVTIEACYEKCPMKVCRL
jgi:chromobox protein 1